MKYVLCFTLIGLIIFRFTVAVAQGIMDTENVVVFSDSFSDDLSSWEIATGSNDYWKLQNGVLIGKISSRFKSGIIIPVLGSNISLKNGYTFAFDMLPVSGTDKNIIFGYQDESNFYDIHFHHNGYELSKISGGLLDWQATGSQTLANMMWHHFELNFSDSSFSITLNDNLLLEASDEKFSGGFASPGLRVTTGTDIPTEVYFDNVVISAEKEPLFLLDVPLLKQTDPLWGSSTYNTADTWSTTPTIHSWGCALTSAAMIMQFYGHTELPDGTSLNPGSLNTWLISQPDGYIGEGLLNWQAITRLSYKLFQVTGNPALLNKRSSGETVLSFLQESLALGKPAIVNVPGHFVVAKGISANNDIIINDPAYNYSLLSEHSSPLSLRHLEPSTDTADFRSLIAAHNPEFIISGNGNTLSETEEIYLQSAENAAHTSKTTAVTYLSAPSENLQEYSINVASADYAFFEIELYAYNQSLDPAVKVLSGASGPSGADYTISLSENTGGLEITVAPQYSFTSLREDLLQMHQSGELVFYSSYLLADEAAALAESLALANPENTTDQLRYISLIREKLFYTSGDYNPQALEYLYYQLTSLENQLSAV